MATLHSIQRSSGFLRCVERWDRWLQERLAPAIVSLNRWFGEDECQWSVLYPLGERCLIRIPERMVRVGPADFERIARTLDTCAWQSALKPKGAEGLDLLSVTESALPASDPRPRG